MTSNEMVFAVTTGISYGIVLKLMVELIFFCLNKIMSWLQLHF